jgi:hypothetical protein
MVSFEKKVVSSVEDGNQSAHSKFGSRLLTDPNAVFQHNAW